MQENNAQIMHHFEPTVFYIKFVIQIFSWQICSSSFSSFNRVKCFLLIFCVLIFCILYLKRKDFSINFTNKLCRFRVDIKLNNQVLNKFIAKYEDKQPWAINLLIIVIFIAENISISKMYWSKFYFSQTSLFGKSYLLFFLNRG